jgi:hypothetical protein
MTAYEVLTATILILTIVAIVAGPIAAVIVTRKGDEARETRNRKSAVLTSLMRTRQARLSFDHVSALNLIQVEFYEDAQVQAAYSSYIANLNQAIPVDPEAFKKFEEQRNDLFIDLLHAVGKHLGYGFDKRDLVKLAYGPIGWYEDENAVKMIRSMAMDLLSGKTSLSVVARQAPSLSQKFPPPP